MIAFALPSTQADTLKEPSRVMRVGTTTFITGLGPIIDMDIAADGGRIAAITMNGVVHVFEPKSAAIETLRRDDRAYSILGVTSVAFGPSGRLLVGTYVDGSVDVWNVSPNGCTFAKTIETGTKSEISAIAFLDGTANVVVGNQSGELIFLNVSNGEASATVQVHKGPINGMCVIPKTTLVCTCGQDGWIRLVDTGHRKVVASMRARDLGISQGLCVASSTDGDRLVIGGSGLAVIWLRVEINGVKSKTELTFGNDAVVSVAYSQSDDVIVLGGGHLGHSGRLVMWPARREDAISRIEDHKDYVTAVVVSKDGTTIAAGGIDGMLTIRNPPQRKQP